MNCEAAREIFMDLIYPEEGLVPSEEFKNHFTQCPRCTREYIDLLATRRDLGSWEDEQPGATTLFVEAPTKAQRHSWLTSWIAWRPAPALAFSLIVVLAFLAFGGLRLSWENGKFAVQTGVFQAASGSVPAATVTPDAQSELLAAVDRMLNDSEARQNRQTLALLQRMSDTMEYKRQMDQFKVREELGLVNQNYYQALEKNSALLEQTAKVLRLNRY